MNCGEMYAILATEVAGRPIRINVDGDIHELHSLESSDAEDGIVFSIGSIFKEGVPDK